MNEIEFDKCSKCDCGQKRPIVNRTHWLCKEKNHERLHGKTLRETQAEKAEKYREKQRSKPVVFKRKPQKKSTFRKKKRPIDQEYSIVIREIASERQKVCTGCGKNQGGDIRLSNSHIISRKQCQEIGRIDLIADKNNITYHCMDFGENEGCHRKWEGPRKTELLDYQRNMEYVKSIDENLYKRLKISAEGDL